MSALIPDEPHLLVYTGLLFILSQAAGRVANRLGAPRLIGYLVAGILLGPSLFGVFTGKLIGEQLGIMTDVALAVIAFSIGGSIDLNSLRSLRGTILWITLLQALGAVAVVTAVSWIVLPWFVGELPVSEQSRAVTAGALTLGAISAATAPAAILSLIHECRAKGSFTTTLLAVVGLDDALAVLIYGFFIIGVEALSVGGDVSLSNALVHPLAETAISVAVGGGTGLLLRGIIRYFAPRDVMLGLILGATIFTAGLARSYGVSPLLATMVLGFVVINFSEHDRAVEANSVVEQIEEPIFGMFFLMAGAHLDLGLALGASGLTAAILLARFAGKLGGTVAGAAVARSSTEIRNYLGFALLPSAGVTIGLILDASVPLSAISPELSLLLVSAVVGSTIINELITPFLVRFALENSGESRLAPPSRFGQPHSLLGRLGSLIGHRNGHR